MFATSGVIVRSALNLNSPGRYLHWGVIQISLANFLVIVGMVGLFALAIALPFPGHVRRTGQHRADPGTTPPPEATHEGGDERG